MSLLLSDDPELRRYGTPLGRKASYNAAYPYKEINQGDLWLKPGLLDEICRLAIKEDGVYVDGEEYSHYQERLPFRLYDHLEFWTIPVPELLIDEIRKHLPKIRL